LSLAPVRLNALSRLFLLLALLFFSLGT